MTILTAVMAFSAVVGVVVAALQWSTLKGQLDEMRKSGNTATQQLSTAIGNINWLAQSMDASVKEAQKAIEASQDQSRRAMAANRYFLQVNQRPWVAVQISKIQPLTFTPGAHGTMRLRFLLKNIGRSPALHVQIKSSIICLPLKTWQNEEADVAQKLICEPLRQKPGSTSDFTLFPDDQLPELQNVYISAKEIQAGLKAKENGPFRHKGFLGAVMLVACVDYQLSFEHKHHQTRYVFQLGVPSPNGGFMSDLRPEGIQPNVELIPFAQSAE